MSLLKNLVPASTRVELPGTHVDVYGLSIATIVTLVGRHPSLVQAFRAKAGEDRIAAVAEAIKSAGPAAVADVIDAATKSEPGTAASLDIVAWAQTAILFAAIRLTLPEDQVGKLIAEGGAWLGALGLEAA